MKHLPLEDVGPGADNNPTLPAWVPTRATALKITLLYVGVSVIWILGSGRLLHYLVSDRDTRAVIEEVKGCFFVGTTALLLGWLLGRYFKTISKSTRLLQENEARLRFVSDNFPDGYVFQASSSAGGPLRYLYLSGGVERLHGVKAGDVIRDSNILHAQVLPEFRSPLQAAETASAAAMTDLNYEMWIRRPDGQLRLLYLNARPRQDGNGQITWNGIATDITERKKTESALHDSERRFQQLVEAAPEAIFIRTGDTFSYLNRAALLLFGASHPDELLNQPVIERFAPGLREKVEEHIRQLDLQGIPTREEERVLIRLDGSKIVVRLTAVPFDHADRQSSLVFARDVTQRREAEQALKASMESFHVMFETTAVGMSQIDPATRRFIRVNQRMCQITGYSAEELCQRTFSEITHPEDRDFDLQCYLRIERGEAPDYRLEKRYVCKNGSIAWVNVNVSVIRGPDGIPLRGLAVIEDITKRKELEMQYLRAQRMEAIGSLAGGIAHDLNNILTPILMASHMLQDSVADKDSQAMLQTVQNCAQRGADIIKQLLTFARGKPGARIAVPVRILIGEMEKIMRETFRRNIKPCVEVSKDLWHVVGDATQIHQALMNLCVNAADAMPEGGVLKISAANRMIGQGFVAENPDASPGKYVCIAVADTGTGISPQNLEKIFDPFFSTKDIGKGTGLGLPTVSGIVRGHGGFMRVESKVGRGSVFELYFPVTEELKPEPAPQCDVATLQGQGEMILVVDDEEPIRKAIQKLLQKCGYNVLLAGNGAEALTNCVQYPGQIKAVISDMMMPEIDGPTLVRALRQMDANLPVLGMTGLAERAEIQGYEALNLSVMLNKPFAEEELLMNLRRAIDSAKS